MTREVFSRPATLVGHRGLGAGVVDGHRENTLSSYLGAVEAGLDWLEVDVQRTADNHVVIAHDALLPDGRFLAQAHLRDAVESGLMTVEDLLETLPDSVGLAFDLKSSFYDAGRSAATTTAALLAQACQRSLRSRRALMLSFDPAALRQVRDALPSMAIGLLTWKHFPVGHAVAAAAHLDVDVLATHAGSLWPSTAHPSAGVPVLDLIVDQVHASNRQLLVWCPSERRARALARAGVDAMVVDEVPRQVNALRRITERASKPAAESCQNR